MGATNGCAADTAGNVYFSSARENSVFRINKSGVVTRVAGVGRLSTFVPRAGAAISTPLNSPQGLAIDKAGNLYIADSGHGCVLKTTPAGQVSSIAGSTAPVEDVFLNDMTTASRTTLYVPQGVAVDSSGNVYIADTGNACIRKVKPDGTIAVVAGDGVFGYTGDGGAAASAQLSAAWSVAVDASGNLYIADFLHRFFGVPERRPTLDM
jgi:DNA-binding beta-propeller fold protein YncE